MMADVMHGECWERSLPQGKPAPQYSEDALDEVYPTGRGPRIKRPQRNLLFDDRIGAQHVCNWAFSLSFRCLHCECVILAKHPAAHSCFSYLAA